MKSRNDMFELATGIKVVFSVGKFFREISVDENYVAENPCIASLWFSFYGIESNLLFRRCKSLSKPCNY